MKIITLGLAVIVFVAVLSALPILQSTPID